MQIQGDFRRKSNTACAPCKRRKIRCDRPGSDDSEQPCSSCRRHGWICTGTTDQNGTTASKDHKSGPHRRQRIQHDATTSVSTATPDCSPTRATLPDESPSASVPFVASADSLKDFYERGIGSRDWNVFVAPPDKDPLRIVYTGSAIANLNRLVQHSSRALHFPFPSIRHRLAWEPSPANRAYLTAAAARDLSTLPPRDVRDSLIETYFGCIHPGLPILDVSEFHGQYASANPSPPLLLLQCMLLAAARISKHPVVVANRGGMTANLYRRAKALFEMRHENDRVILVQSALLMTWHVEDSDSVSNGPYYWIGLATRTAFGLGMHRDLSDDSASLMPSGDRRLYRRLWWATLRFEVYTALEYGRPSMIRTEDFDQTPLDLTDFICGDGTEDRAARPEFCMLDARLCILALAIIRLAAPGVESAEDEAAMDQQLVLLAIELPSMLDFWSCQLRITHGLLILMLHRARKYRNPASEFAAQEAVSTILVASETMLAHDTIDRLNFYACTPLLAAAVHLSQGVASDQATPSNLKEYTSYAQLERLLKPIEALARTWPHMEPVSKLTTLLSSHCRRTVFRQAEPVEPASFDLGDITLDSLLSEYCFPSFARTLDGSDQNIAL